MPNLLIIDDERNVLYSLEKGLRQDGLTILTAETARDGLAIAGREPVDAILMDIQLPDLSGLDALARIRKTDRKTPVIMMTAHGTADTAIEAMKRGAFDYVLKPWDLSEMRDIVARALAAGHLSRVPAVFDDTAERDDLSADRIVGRCQAMQDVFKEIGRVAPLNVNVLILGESGTGKELAARAIYYHSARSDKPFLAINCAALPESLLESELFGHEKGSFTGAERRRIGKFEQADGGTLFLDEIGDMTASTQAKVLRVLQDGRFERVGGNATISANVRVLAATNKPLDEAIERKEFRQDLFYRLNTFSLWLPPLRDRKGDVRLLADYFLRKSRYELGSDCQGLSQDALKLLERHNWPGNVRELESAIRYALVHATSQVVQRDDFPSSVTGIETSPESSAAERSVISNQPTESAADEWSELRGYIRQQLQVNAGKVNAAIHDAVDRVLLEEVLRWVDGHQSNAAEALGISRTTLRSRMQQLGVTVERAVSADRAGASD